NHTLSNRKGLHVHPDLEARLAALETPPPPPTPTPTPGQFPGYADKTHTVTPTMTAEQVQSLLAEAPSNAIVGFAAGTHQVDFWGSKEGQTFVGELDTNLSTQFPKGRPLTILDGTGRQAGSGVKVLKNQKAIGFEVRNWPTNDQQDGIAADAGTDGKCTLAYIYAHHNRYGGIGFAGDVEVGYFESSDNGAIGWRASTYGDHDVRTGGFVHHGLIQRNNAALGFDPAWEAGGCKSLNHTNQVCEDLVYVQNGGPGHWVDHGGTGNVARRIQAVENVGAGIMWEITDTGLIEDFDVLDQTAIANPMPGALYLSNAANVVVRQGKVEGKSALASLAVEDRLGRSPETMGNSISDVEIIRLSTNQWSFGAATWGFGGAIDADPATMRATFDANRYRVAANLQGAGWGWPNRSTWTNWQAQGYDPNSTLAAI
ncbi:MAG: hypothetical protein ABR609_06000, partial [Acidimicrobiia bacterium]